MVAGRRTPDIDEATGLLAELALEQLGRNVHEVVLGHDPDRPALVDHPGDSRSCSGA